MDVFDLSHFIGLSGPLSCEDPSLGFQVFFFFFFFMLYLYSEDFKTFVLNIFNTNLSPGFIFFFNK